MEKIGVSRRDEREDAVQDLLADRWRGCKVGRSHGRDRERQRVVPAFSEGGRRSAFCRSGAIHDGVGGGSLQPRCNVVGGTLIRPRLEVLHEDVLQEILAVLVREASLVAASPDDGLRDC